jgi:hypothetical protein
MGMRITVTMNMKTGAEKCITEEDTGIRIAYPFNIYNLSDKYWQARFGACLFYDIS